MRGVRRVGIHLALAVFCAALISCGPKAGPRDIKHVFIVSLDQGSPHNLMEAEMPVLKELVREGAHTWEAFTIVPSITLPSHVSLLTGVGIQKHQILWNEFLPDRGKLEVPTVFSIAKQHGLTTALYAGKSKFLTFRGETPFDAFRVPPPSGGYKAEEVAKAFAADVAKVKPNICFIHFPDADRAGHRYGVDSPQKIAALGDCDRALKIVTDAIEAAGLKDSSVIIITADHGGHDRTPEEVAAQVAAGREPQPGTHGEARTSDVVIPWIASGRGVKKGFTITQPVVIYDTAATALWALGLPVPEGFWGRPVKSAFEGQ